MADLRQAAQMALEALEWSGMNMAWNATGWSKARPAIDTLRAALAAVQEPVAWMDRYGACIPNAMRACMLSDGGASESTASLYTTPLYTHPAPAAQPLPAPPTASRKALVTKVGDEVITTDLLPYYGPEVIGGTNAG